MLALLILRTFQLAVKILSLAVLPARTRFLAGFLLMTYSPVDMATQFQVGDSVSTKNDVIENALVLSLNELTDNVYIEYYENGKKARDNYPSGALKHYQKPEYDAESGTLY